VHVALGHRYLVDRLAVAQRDLPERAGELAVEGEREDLVDDQAAVACDLDDDVRLRDRERLRRRLARERERGEDDDRDPDQKRTCGASRAAGSSTSKYSRGSKLNMPATMFAGTVSIALSYERTASL
jgi:hypothetical protein